MKVVVNFIYGYQNLSGEKYKTNEKRFSSIGHTSYEKIPIIGSKMKVVVNFIYGYQDLSGEKYKTNGKRISLIGLTS